MPTPFAINSNYYVTLKKDAVIHLNAVRGNLTLYILSKVAELKPHLKQL